MRLIYADALMHSFIKKANTMKDRHGVKLAYERGKAEARPQGEWITIHYSREELNVPQKASMFDFVKCPFCETIHQGRRNFCSRCGADMRGGRE